MTRTNTGNNQIAGTDDSEQVTNGLLERMRNRADLDRNDSGFSLIELIVVIVMIGVLAAIIIPVFGHMQENKEGAGSPGVSGSSEISEEEEMSEPTPAPSAEPTNWQPLIWAGGGLITIIMLSGGGFIVFRTTRAVYRSQQNSKSKKTEAEAMRSTAINRHQNILVQYSSYETDMWKALSYPALHDVEVVETSNFLKAMRDAEAQKKAMNEDKRMLSDYLYEQYMKSVSILEYMFSIAENKAIRLGDGNLSSAEQKDIKTARMLLSHAEDSGNNAELRANYYEQLKKIIGRLNERHKTPIIPEPTFTALEQQTRLLLTGGSPESIGIANSGQEDVSAADTLLTESGLSPYQKRASKSVR